MSTALDAFRIEGIRHNIPFLSAIMSSLRFREGRLSTDFIAEEFPEGFRGRPLDGARARIFALAAVAARIRRARRASAISGTLDGPVPANGEFVVSLDEKEFTVTDATLQDGQLRATIDGAPAELQIAWNPGEALMSIAEGSARRIFQVSRDRGGYLLSEGGTKVLATVRWPEAAQLAALMPRKSGPDTSKYLLAPMPGLVVSINVAEGQDVKTGETLAVVEAMKMENVLNADRDGTIGKIKARQGDSLAVDDVILEFA